MNQVLSAVPDNDESSAERFPGQWWIQCWALSRTVMNPVMSAVPDSDESSWAMFRTATSQAEHCQWQRWYTAMSKCRNRNIYWLVFFVSFNFKEQFLVFMQTMWVRLSEKMSSSTFCLWIQKRLNYERNGTQKFFCYCTVQFHVWVRKNGEEHLLVARSVKISRMTSSLSQCHFIYKSIRLLLYEWAEEYL